MNKIKWKNNGLGGNPLQEGLEYLGYTIYLYPLEFLSLASRTDQYESSHRLSTFMLRGEAFAPPWLAVEWEEKENMWKVINHKGRNRSLAAHDVDSESLMPVHIFPINVNLGQVTKIMKKAEIVAREGSAVVEPKMSEYE